MRKITKILVEIEEQDEGKRPQTVKCSSSYVQRGWQIIGVIFPRHLEFLNTISDAARRADKG